MADQFTSQSPLKSMPNYVHNPLRIALILFSAILLLITLAFNGLSASPANAGGVFLSGQANLSDFYYLSVTPAGWTFSIWGVIYTFQVLWAILAIVSIFMKASEGFLYLTPAVFPASLFLAYCAGNVMNIAWLFSFDRKVLELALVCLLAIAVSMWTAVGISLWALHRHSGQMQKEFHRVWTIAIRVCVQNGVAMYATWTSIATLLNLAHVMTYRGSVSESSASTTALSLLLIELLVFAAIDFTLIDRHFRFLYTPYITFIVALIGSLANGQTCDPNCVPKSDPNCDPTCELSRERPPYGKPKTTVNQNFTIALLAIACLVFVLKMVSLIRKPLGTNKI